eukprot:6257723-Alexandrium_andersonii.AAC.1
MTGKRQQTVTNLHASATIMPIDVAVTQQVNMPIDFATTMNACRPTGNQPVSYTHLTLPTICSV